MHEDEHVVAIPSFPLDDGPSRGEVHLSCPHDPRREPQDGETAHPFPPRRRARDAFAVRRHDRAVDLGAVQGMLKRIGRERPTGYNLKILVHDPTRTRTQGNDAKDAESLIHRGRPRSSPREAKHVKAVLTGGEDSGAPPHLIAEGPDLIDIGARHVEQVITLRDHRAASATTSSRCSIKSHSTLPSEPTIRMTRRGVLSR